MEKKKKTYDTSSYKPPISPIKIPKSSKGFEMIKKDLSEEQAPETGAYEPPISPVKIPKGDTGFNAVKKGYRRFIWSWNEYIGKKPKFTKT